MRFSSERHVASPRGYNNGREWLYRMMCSCGWSSHDTYYQAQLRTYFSEHLRSV